MKEKIETPKTKPKPPKTPIYLAELGNEVALNVTEPEPNWDLHKEIKERIPTATKTIETAITKIESDKSISQKLKDKKIQLLSPSYYLPIALKESNLDPKSEYGGALGLFQVNSSALAEVNRIFDKQINKTDIFYNGTESKKLKNAAQANALVGILYFHICRDIYGQNFGIESEEDREKMALFKYNLGYGYFKKIWKTLNKPKNYQEFAQKLSKTLADKTDGLEFLPEGRRLKNDQTGGYYFSQLAFEEDANTAKIRNTKVEIGATLTVGRFIATLAYVGTITDLREKLSDYEIT